MTPTNSLTPASFDPKAAGEIVMLAFDVADVAGVGVTILTPTVSATVHRSTDATPAAILSGSATVLRAQRLPVMSFQTTAASKSSAIEALALAFEQGAIRIPAVQWLLDELQGWQFRSLAEMSFIHASVEKTTRNAAWRSPTLVNLRSCRLRALCPIWPIPFGPP